MAAWLYSLSQLCEALPTKVHCQLLELQDNRSIDTRHDNARTEYLGW